MKKFKIFGFHVVISREAIKTKLRPKNRNAYRSSQRNIRLELTDNKCEVCGRPIDKTCRLHRTLPAGSPDRNLWENIRVMCADCYHELEKKPHILGYQQLERDADD